MEPWRRRSEALLDVALFAAVMLPAVAWGLAAAAAANGVRQGALLVAMVATGR